MAGDAGDVGGPESHGMGGPGGFSVGFGSGTRAKITPRLRLQSSRRQSQEPEDKVLGDLSFPSIKASEMIDISCRQPSKMRF